MSEGEEEALGVGEVAAGGEEVVGKGEAATVVVEVATPVGGQGVSKDWTPLLSRVMSKVDRIAGTGPLNLSSRSC